MYGIFHERLQAYPQTGENALRNSIYIDFASPCRPIRKQTILNEGTALQIIQVFYFW